MGWFEEQLKIRHEMDEENFLDSLDAIAGSVLGKLPSEVQDARVVARSAVEEILRYYHFKGNIPETPDDLESIEEQLQYYTSGYGITTRPVILDHGWHKQAVGPMIGTLKEGGHQIALIPNKMGGYSYRDPGTGRRINVRNSTEKLINADAICFYQPLPLKPLTLKDLVVFMFRQLSVSDIVLFLGMTGVVTLLGMLMPVFTKLLFGSVLQSGNYTVLTALTGFMVCYLFSRLCVSAFLTLQNSKITTKMSISVESAVMNRLMHLPTSFFREYAAGDLTQRSLYMQSLCTEIVNSFATVGITSLFSLLYLGQISHYAPSLALPSILITLCTVIVSLITTYVQMKITKEAMQMTARTSGLTYATITGIQKIKLAGAEKRMFSRWGRQYAKESSLLYNPPMFLKLSNALSLTITLFGTLILYYLAVKNQVSTDDYYAFNSAYAMISGAFLNLATLATSIANIKPALEMAMPIMQVQPETSENRTLVRKLNGGIELEKVSFRYDDSMPNVIDNLSLKIKPGEYLAIVGTTGCGKSTLMRLLLGFEIPQSGSIYYDRKDISKLDLRSLRRNIGSVMQDGKLFLSDIYSNIVIASPSATLDDAWAAAEIADIADDIRKMPMGMHTLISEGQGGISGGQKQRLMIARAIASRPSILMFDEATSALDNISQKKISNAIDELNCTRIVIAHRLSTIRNADRIICLDKGKIAEEGTYDELIAQNGFFAELVSRQRLDV